MTPPTGRRSGDLASAAAAWLEWQAAMGAVDPVAGLTEPRVVLVERLEAAGPDATTPRGGPTPEAPGAQSPSTSTPTSPPQRRNNAQPAISRNSRPAGDRVLHAREIAASCPTLETLREALDHFEACPLRATATQLCFADGVPEARLMIIGEAPGAEEDRTGVPFVGESGQLLDRILAAIGLDRRHVWITNTIFWRPPGNRPPTPVEVGICTAFLERQIELIDPAMLLLLGGAAARAVLNVTDGPTQLRGRRLTYEAPWGKAYPSRVTFHPANLLRTPLNKRLVWRDLLATRLELDELLGPGALPPLRPTAREEAGN